MTSSGKSARPWIIFAGCCVMSFIGFALVTNTVGLYYTPVSEELGVPYTSVVFSSTVMSVCSIIASLFAGKLLQKIDTRIVISACILILGCGFFGLSAMTELWQLYVIFGVMGFAYIIALGLAPNVLMSNWFEDRLGLVMGVAGGVSGLGGMVFNPIITQFIGDFGWRTSYVITGVIMLVCILPFSIFAFKYRPDESKGERAYGHGAAKGVASEGERAIEGVSAGEAYRSPSFWLIGVAYILLQIVAGLVQQVSNLEQLNGLTAAEAALVVSGIMFGAFLGKSTIGAFLDRIAPELVIIVYAVIGAAGWGLMSVIVNATGAIGSGVAAGIGQGVLLISIPWFIRMCFGRKDYAQISAIAGIFSSVSSALAQTAHSMAFTATGSYGLSLIVNVACYALAVVCIIAAYRMRPVKKMEKAAA